MSSDSKAYNALVPLVLRLSLAAIFIYHGVDKVFGPGNDWGTNWASHIGAREGAPEDVLAKLDALPGASDAQLKRMKEQLNLAYNQEGKVPSATLNFVGAQMAVAWGELLCGVALLIGFLTRLSAVAMIVIQIGAIATVTWARGFSSVQGVGYEYNLVIIGACLALVFAGAGPLALDRRLLHWWQQRGQATPAAREPVPVG